jgi:hypothetical protein
VLWASDGSVRRAVVVRTDARFNDADGSGTIAASITHVALHAVSVFTTARVVRMNVGTRKLFSVRTQTGLPSLISSVAPV